MVNRTKKGRFLKPTQVARYNQQLKNLHKSSEECDQLVNLDTFVPLFDTQHIIILNLLLLRAAL